MTIELLQHENNPSRLVLWLVNGEERTEILTTTERQFTLPLKTTDTMALDPADETGRLGWVKDPLIIQGFKVAFGKPGGFSSWQEAKGFIESIPDVVTYAAAMGHDFNHLIAG